MKFRKTITLLVMSLLIFIGCQSCQSPVLFWSNDDIEPSIKDAVMTQNTTLFTAISKNDSQAVEQLLSKEYLNNGYTATNMIDFLKKYLSLSPVIYSECYFIAKNINDGYRKYQFSNESPYFLSLAVHEKEAFILFFTVEDANIDYIINIIYIKNDDQWKILSGDVAYFGFNNMNIQNLVDKANDAQHQSKLFSSYIYYEWASSISRPFSFLLYDDTERLVGLTNEARRKVSAHLPIEVITDVGNATISSICVIETEAGIVPAVICHTKIDITNLDVVNEIGEAIAEKLERVFPDIKTENLKIEIRFQ